jgi:hypothetical protein
MVLTEGGPLSNLVEREGMGLVVPPQDVAALADAIRRLATDRELADATRRRVSDVARRFRWSEVAGPLLEFCRSPHRAADATSPEALTDRRYNLGVAHDMRNPWLRRVVRVVFVVDQYGVSDLVRRVVAKLRPKGATGGHP